jgi:hypothetical protein
LPHVEEKAARGSDGHLTGEQDEDMTDERTNKIVMSGAKTIITMMFVFSVALVCKGWIMWAGVLFPAYAVVCVFCNRLASAIAFSLFGIGVILHGYGEEVLATWFLILGGVILVGRHVLTSRNAWREVRRIKAQGEREVKNEK